MAQEKPVLAYSMLMAKPDNFLIETHYVQNKGVLHWHDYYEMEIVFQGQGMHRADGNTWELARGSVFLLTPHNFHSVSSANGSLLKLFTINFNTHMLPEKLRQIIVMQEEVLTCHFPEKEFGGFLDKILALKNNYDKMDTFTSETSVALFTLICIDFLRKVHAKNRQTLLDTNSLVGNVIIYLKQNYRQALTKQEVAKNFHVSANYLGNKFKSATGETFIEYLNNIRLMVAVRLLCMGNINITTVCYEAGFNSPAYFIKLFKMRFGCTPAAYRKTAKAISAGCGG